MLDAVCWRTTAIRLSVLPEDGMEVIATGRLTTYPGPLEIPARSSIRSSSPGDGALLKLLEDRRQRLAAEGLFAAERKRKLPFLPEVIGVVTSPTGAVIRDILHRLADRFPRRVLVWPVAVQGENAAAQIAAAIEGFNRLSPGGARAAARPDHRRARRRQPRRSDGVQRGDRRARRGGLGDPADLGGRARDRHDPDRPRQRPPRPDPDRRRRDGGAGAARPDRRAQRQDRAGSRRGSGACSASGGCTSTGWRAACPTRTT